LSNFVLIKKISPILLFLVIISGCASKIHLQPEAFERHQSIITKEIINAQQIADFKGSGTITIVEDGRRSSGKCDVRFNLSDGNFRAQIYSPFGTTAARIDADSLGGRVRAGNDEYSFALDESMEELPLSWGGYFTFRQFMQILIGKMPAELTLLDSRPDSLTFDKSAAVALWNRDTLTVEARIGRKSERLESVAFNYDILGNTFALRYGRFKNGAPGEIAIHSDSRNYILLRYDR